VVAVLNLVTTWPLTDATETTIIISHNSRDSNHPHSSLFGKHPSLPYNCSIIHLTQILQTTANKKEQRRLVWNEHCQFLLAHQSHNPASFITHSMPAASTKLVS